MMINSLQKYQLVLSSFNYWSKILLIWLDERNNRSHPIKKWFSQVLLSLGDCLHPKKNYDHFIPSADIDDQRFCNLIGEETQLATSNQEVVSHATLDDCVYTKNLRDWSIPSILFEIMMIKETCNLLGREA